MALEIKEINYYGISLPNVFCKIENILINKSIISFNLSEYADTSNPSFRTTSYLCDYDIDGGNPFKQAYEYLKTLEEFKDAIDV